MCAGVVGRAMRGQHTEEVVGTSQRAEKQLVELCPSTIPEGLGESAIQYGEALREQTM